jgi:hypothetical protein
VHRTTVYRRAVETNYALKSKSSRALVAEVNRRFPFLPFSLRALVAGVEKGETGVRAGVLEPLTHGVLHAHPVLEEKTEGAAVAHFKSTALMLPGGTLQATGKPLPEYIKSEKSREWPRRRAAQPLGGHRYGAHSARRSNLW